MQDAPEVKTGDRVRVILEGVASLYGQGFEVGRGMASNCIRPGAQHVVSIEVLKPQLKVGDYLRSEQDYEDAPIGTVAHCSDSTLVKARNGQWYEASSHSQGYNDPSYPRVVLALPE